MFLALEARISPFYYTRILELNQEKSGNIPGKNGKLFFSKKFETQKFQNFGNLSLPIFEFLKFRNPGFLLIRNDESLEMMNW